MVAVTQCGTNRTGYRIIAVGYLTTKHGLGVKEVLDCIRLLGTDQTKLNVVVAADALLCLKLRSNELMADVFHIANTSEGHLLLYIVAKPFTTDGVTKDSGYDRTEEQTTIEHRL